MRKPFALAILALGCRSTQSTEPIATVDVGRVDGSTPTGSVARTALAHAELREIVAPERARSFYWRAKDGTTFFRPSDAEIASFETELVPFLEKEAPKNRFGEPPLAKRAPSYLRVYVGHVEADGTRLIWGNFMCRYNGDDKDGWRKEGYGVKDGGDCYFNVEFSPREKAFRSLSINGDG